MTEVKKIKNTQRSPKAQATFVYFLFFLSDSGPSDAVANTLYRGENENLCVRVCLVAVVVVTGSAKTGSHRGGVHLPSHTHTDSYFRRGTACSRLRRLVQSHF